MLESRTTMPLLLFTLMPAPGSTITVTPVLPATATTGMTDGFGAFALHVAVSPLAGARLSQTASAGGARNRHAMPIDRRDSAPVRDTRMDGNDRRVRRIFLSPRFNATEAFARSRSPHAGLVTGEWSGGGLE